MNQAFVRTAKRAAGGFKIDRAFQPGHWLNREPHLLNRGRTRRPEFLMVEAYGFMTFFIDTLDEFIPSIPPPGGSPARQSATTQVTVKVGEWPGNVFRMWMPESVGEL